MIALPNKSEASTGTRVTIEKISSDPFDLSAALQALAQKRIIQLEPPVTNQNRNAFALITAALSQGKCDIIADIFYMWCGMVKRLSLKDLPDESEESLRLAEIRFLIHPVEPTPHWIFAFGYPVEE